MASTIWIWRFNRTIELLRERHNTDVSKEVDEKQQIAEHNTTQLSELLNKFIPECSYDNGYDGCRLKRRYILKDLGLLKDDTIPKNEEGYPYDHHEFRAHLIPKLRQIESEATQQCVPFEDPRDKSICMRVAADLIEFMKKIAYGQK